MSKPLYIVITIRADIEELWMRTQDPEQHQRWDLRFSSISYLPKDQEDDPQRFEYATRIGFGLRVAGWGESIATREQDSSRTSSLRFGSAQTMSLIEEGSGYWKYTPCDGAIRFETGYDYTVRWGVIGRVFDACVFRPLIGWATAWSFDRLRLWIEQGIDPTLAAARSLVHAVCRVVLAFVFFWHGLVPKLIARHPDELSLIEASGFELSTANRLLIAAGVFEMMLALLLLIFWRARWLYTATGAVLLALLVPAVAANPGLVAAPFGPISLTAALLGLCLIGWVACIDLPSAHRCARSKKVMEQKVGSA